MKRIADPLLRIGLVGYVFLLVGGCVSSGRVLSRNDPIYRDVELLDVVSFQKKPKTAPRSDEARETDSVRSKETTSSTSDSTSSENDAKTKSTDINVGHSFVTLGHIDTPIEETNSNRTQQQSSSTSRINRVKSDHVGSMMPQLGFEMMDQEEWNSENLFGSTNRTFGIQPAGANSLPVVSSTPWQLDLERLITRTEADLASRRPHPSQNELANYRRQQVFLRTLYLFAGRESQSLTAIPNLPPIEQEYWQQMMWTAVNSLDAERYSSTNERALQTLVPLSSAIRCLREQADLSIKNMAFCEQISNFGNYQKFHRDEFTPGQDVLLYAEIENFHSDLTEDGEYRTSLKSVIDIVGPTGESRWNKIFTATEDRCRNPRRDYFHNYQFAIPDRLPLGPHTLMLTVIDELSGKRAVYSLKFLVK